MSSQTQPVKPLKRCSAIESIPEDVSSVIAEEIRSWTIPKGGSLKEKKVRRKLRDSTLRAISLTSSRNLLRWQPQLLHSVTITQSSLESFCLFLMKQRMELLSCIRSLCYHHDANLSSRTQPEILANIAHRSTLRSLPQGNFPMEIADLGDRHVASGFNFYNQCILASLPNLEEVIVEDQFLIFPLHLTLSRPGSNGKSAFGQITPLPFLTQSLKKLYVKLAEHGHMSFSGRNAVWLLMFCENLNEAAISFDISRKDVDYLSELLETYKNCSKVKKLAIGFRFICSQSGRLNPQWKAKGKDQESGLSRAEKLQSILNLIQVTNRLEAFEINTAATFGSQEDEPDFRTVLSRGLSSSESTLRHLRGVLDVGEPETNLTFDSNWSLFKNLKILSVDRASLKYLEREKLELNIEILQLMYYTDCSIVPPEMEELIYSEDTTIGMLIESQLLPKLKTICLPNLININNHKMEANKEIWFKRRRELQWKEFFTSGKIELKELEAGLYAGDASKGSDFLSTLRWVSH